MRKQMRPYTQSGDDRGPASRFSRRIGWLLLLVSLLVSCRPDLVRYNNRPLCSSYLDDTRLPDSTDLRFGIPANEYAAGLQWTWLPNDAQFALYTVDNILHLIDHSGHQIAEQDHDRPYWPNALMSVSSMLDMYALTFGSSYGQREEVTEVYSFHDLPQEELTPLAMLRELERPVWHPTEPMLADKYPVGNATVLASNLVAVFDLTQSLETPTRLFELDWSDIDRVIGWNFDGSTLAVNQWGKNGLAPVYVDVETGTRTISSFATSPQNCAIHPEWSPTAHSLAFQGRTENSEGFDIFIEKAITGNRGQSVTTNLTNSLGEDEGSVSWSPDGTQIAYVHGYLDEVGAYQQELAGIVVDENSLEPVQLTGTADEFETRPQWISNNEIAYLSWFPSESRWYLKTLSIDRPEESPQTIMEIPQSWYRVP